MVASATASLFLLLLGRPQSTPCLAASRAFSPGTRTQNGSLKVLPRCCTQHFCLRAPGAHGHSSCKQGRAVQSSTGTHVSRWKWQLYCERRKGGWALRHQSLCHRTKNSCKPHQHTRSHCTQYPTTPGPSYEVHTLPKRHLCQWEGRRSGMVPPGLSRWAQPTNDTSKGGQPLQPHSGQSEALFFPRINRASLLQRRRWYTQVQGEYHDQKEVIKRYQNRNWHCAVWLVNYWGTKDKRYQDSSTSNGCVHSHEADEMLFEQSLEIQKDISKRC